MELGTYTQGEYVPSEVAKQDRVRGSTAIKFSRPGEERSPYDTSIIFIIDDPELRPVEQDTLVPDIQLPNVHNRQDFGLLLRKLNASQRRNKRRLNSNGGV